MNKFLISESEKSRILNMHKNATKRQYLSEQSWKWKQGDPMPEKLDPSSITTTVTLDYYKLTNPEYDENQKKLRSTPGQGTDEVPYKHEATKLTVEVKGIPNLTGKTFVYEFTITGLGLMQFGPITDATVNGDILTFTIPLSKDKMSGSFVDDLIRKADPTKRGAGDTKELNYLLEIGSLPSYYDTKQLRRVIGQNGIVKANEVANPNSPQPATQPVAQQPQSGATPTQPAAQQAQSGATPTTKS